MLKKERGCLFSDFLRSLLGSRKWMPSVPLLRWQSSYFFVHPLSLLYPLSSRPLTLNYLPSLAPFLSSQRLLPLCTALIVITIASFTTPSQYAPSLSGLALFFSRPRYV